MFATLCFVSLEFATLNDLFNFFLLFQYTNAIMGYGPEDKNAVLELTYNYGVTEYDKGNGYTQVTLFLLVKHILLFGN